MKVDQYWMEQALILARQARVQNEVPVGAVLVQGEALIGAGFNCSITRCDPTAHAEIEAIRAAAKIQHNYRLVDTTLYVTLEPCIMCVGAIIHARIARVVWGASDLQSFNLWEHAAFNHHPVITAGILADSCRELLVNFFKIRRKEAVC